MTEQHWSISLHYNGRPLLTIGSKGLRCKDDISAEEEEVIRQSGEHLLAFAGTPGSRLAAAERFSDAELPF